jgi:signal transduction histidine kinase/CheY-like chemotaxis protein
MGLIMRFISICLLWLFSQAGLCLNYLDIERQEPVTELSHYLYYVEDSSGQLDLTHIRELPKTAWQKDLTQTPNFGFTDSVYWFWFDLENSTPDETRWLLEVGYPILDHVDIYSLSTDRASEHWELGDTLLFHKRPIAHRNFVVPLRLGSLEKTSIYLRVQSKGSMQVPLTLWSEQGFNEKDHTYSLIHGIFFGLFVVMALYNLFLYLSVRDISFLYYVGFVCSFLVLLMSLSGYGFQHIWPYATDWQAINIPILVSLALIFSSLFTQRFLHIQKDNSLKFYGLALLVAMGMANLAATFVIPYALEIKILMLICILSGVISFAIGVSCWFNFGSAARYFSVSWVMVIMGAVIIALNRMGYLPAYEWVEYIPASTAALQSLILSFALGNRIQAERTEKLAAQRQALESQREALKARLIAREVEFKSEQIKIEVEAESRAKSEFLAMMSHEIRTPLNGIMGMADLLRSTNLDEQLRRYVNTIYSSGESLLTIINDILDFSKIQAGKLEIEKIPVNLLDLIDDCSAIFSSKVFSKNIILLCTLDANTPVLIQSDPVRLRQVILNYLSNAIKFTDKGHVELKLSLDTRNEMLSISVTDSGAGIPEDKQKLLFRSFTQADSSTTRRYGGTGLGLAICKKLSELMGGSTGLHSTLGIGSTFWFTCKVDILDDNAPDTTNFQHKNVALLMEPGIERDWLTTQLNTFAANIIYCEANNVENIVCDWLFVDNQKIPEDGLDALLHRVHLLPERCVYFDARDYKPAIYRPLTSADLLRLCNTQESTNTHTLNINHDDEHPLNGIRILVAEDNAVNQMVIEALLKKLGADAELVENGVRVLQRITDEPQGFDLILMDCEMPEMDGFSATQAIRALEQQQNRHAIPIIALTAHAMDEHKKRAKEVGMNGFVTKPIKRMALLQSISDILSQTVDIDAILSGKA